MNHVSLRSERKRQGSERRVSDAHRAVGELLLTLGVTPHLSGYDPLSDGIRMTAERKRACAAHRNELFEAVETLCGTTNGEHAIRDAIDVGFASPGDLHAQIFPYTDRPTNAEFVCTLAELVRDRLTPS